MTVEVRVDLTRCEGNGICALVSGGVIELDEWGYAAVVRSPLTTDRDRRRARRAAAACPRRAVVVTDPVPATGGSTGSGAPWAT